MKQTAVEWLYEELLAQFHLQIDSFIAHELKGKLKQAKEMEKEQIKNAWLNSLTKGDYNSADEYYNENYKNEPK
jgi:hypothetical protein